MIPRTTPVIQVIGTMRNFTGALGVRCQFSHEGEEGQPLEQFDFAKDEKRTKLVARQMMLMVQEINRRIDTLPPGASSLAVESVVSYRRLIPPRDRGDGDLVRGRCAGT